MLEKRLELRQRLNYYVTVRDRTTDQPIGRVIDITSGGVRVFSEERIKTERPLQLMLELPREFEGSSYLMFDVKPVWSAQELSREFPEFYDTGMKMVNLSTQDLLMIKALVDEYSPQSIS